MGLLFAAALALVLIVGLFVVHNHIVPTVEAKKTHLAIQSLRTAEIEQVKEYARLFGIDSSGYDISNTDILKMGESLKELLGAETFKQIEEKATTSFLPQVKSGSTEQSHQTGVLIETSNLIMRYAAGIALYLRGGSADDEERSFTYTAA